MKYQYEVLDEKEVYRGFFNITKYRLQIDYYDGTRSAVLERECLGKKGFVVAALPYDPVRREFVLIEQFRVGAMASGGEAWQREIVAGFLSKDDEDFQAAMQRELFEEIGCHALELEEVCVYYPSPGGSGGRTVIFFAKVDAEQVASYTGLREEGEDIRVLRLSYEEVFSLLHKNKIDNATSLIALQAFYIKKFKELS